MLHQHRDSPQVEEQLRHAVAHRSEFMRPWPASAQSLASGILDDVTYDWFALVRGMIMNGGYPVVVSEALLEEANERANARRETPVCATGSSGLAGVMRLRDAGLLAGGERVGCEFTGIDRAFEATVAGPR